MGKKRVTTVILRRVERLRTEQGLTLKQACAALGISPASYYSHTRGKNPFLAIERDWDALVETFRPELPDKVIRRLIEGELGDFRHEVGERFRYVYSRPAALLTAGQLADEIEPFANQLLKLVRLWERLSFDGKKRAEVLAQSACLDEVDLANLMEEIREPALGFHGALQVSRHPLSPSVRGRGGRKFDTRPRLIAADLASRFARIVRQEPVAWLGPDGEPGGAFNAFAHHAFAHFLGRDTISDYTIQDSLAFAAARMDLRREAAGLGDAAPDPI